MRFYLEACTECIYGSFSHNRVLRDLCFEGFHVELNFQPEDSIVSVYIIIGLHLVVRYVYLKRKRGERVLWKAGTMSAENPILRYAAVGFPVMFLVSVLF